MPCDVCGGVGWTYDPDNTHLAHGVARAILNSSRLRFAYGISEGLPPLPCARCNRNTPELLPMYGGSMWLPYYPRWERDADGDRTSSVEWQKDSRCRHLRLMGIPVIVKGERLARRKV